ncbi:MAG: BlaI/MecI/CopY family transcriptional regulator [Frankiales bacterium]|nr:BlaI/MecI/CopY family transcriptional regulator [Frankiales bacterium]
MTLRRRAGDLEAEVLAALWSAGRPLTPGEVRDRLDHPPAYTTVTTVLVRLTDKGIVTRARPGRAYVYAPALDRAELAAARMTELLGSHRDRAEVLARFAGSLSPADAAVLSSLLPRGSHLPRSSRRPRGKARPA